jgi:hypothetical protein
MNKVRTEELNMRQLRWCTEVYTLSSSVKIRAENVIVTMFVKDSWKNIIVPSIMTQPWKTDLKNQMRKVLTESERPF